MPPPIVVVGPLPIVVPGDMGPGLTTPTVVTVGLELPGMAGVAGIVPLPVPPVAGPPGTLAGRPIVGTPTVTVAPVLGSPGRVPLGGFVVGGVGGVVLCAKPVAALSSATRAITKL